MLSAIRRSFHLKPFISDRGRWAAAGGGHGPLFIAAGGWICYACGGLQNGDMLRRVAVSELEQSKATEELVMDVHFTYIYVEEGRLLWASGFELKNLFFNKTHFRHEALEMVTSMPDCFY